MATIDYWAEAPMHREQIALWPQLAGRFTQLARRALLCRKLCLSHKAALAPFQRGS